MTFDVHRYNALLPEVIADLVAAELQARRPQKFASLSPSDVRASQDWRQDFALDSLDRMALSTACAEFFNVYDSGREDTLLGLANCVRWSEIVVLAQNEATRNITFRSSGSTGAAKHFRHRAEWLAEEATHWGLRVLNQRRRRIVSHVPLHHIYGYLWGALLASVSKLPWIRQSAVSLQAPALMPGDLLISTPHIVEAWIARGFEIGENVIAVTSTGRFASGNSNDACKALRLASIWEIYGSSETGGLGLRESGEGSYRWLPHFTPNVDVEDAQTVASVTRSLNTEAITIALPDTVKVAESGDRFVVGARSDNVVKLAGHRVDLDQLRLLLKTMPGIRDANVRATVDGIHPALKVFVVPADDACRHDELVAVAKRWLLENWQHSSAVSSWTVGDKVPMNSIGKPSDW